MTTMAFKKFYKLHLENIALFKPVICHSLCVSLKHKISNLKEILIYFQANLLIQVSGGIPTIHYNIISP